MPALLTGLQRIQGQFGYLKREELERFSKDSGVPLYRLQTVASFFPHFLLSPPRRVTLRVCRDMACHLAGTSTMLSELHAAAGKDLSVLGVSCLSRCDRAPVATISVEGDGREHTYVARNVSELRQLTNSFIQGEGPAADLDAHQPYPSKDWIVDPYEESASRYGAAFKAIHCRNAAIEAATRILSKTFAWRAGKIEQFRGFALRSRDESEIEPDVLEALRSWRTESEWAKGPDLGGWSDSLLNELKEADLRGLGGAGIPAIQKWRDVREAVRTAFMREGDTRAFIVVNGDESEPGTFKDRELLLRTPHLIVDAVIVAGLITDATEGFIYIRHEYEEQIEACREAIAVAEELGLCGENPSMFGRPFPVSVFISPGGYICGEQSALIEAMSDRRGEPRNMPPKLETNGLEDLPTLVSNVETFAWVPYILMNGGKAYAAQGVNGWHGRRFFSVSGDVKRPGVYEVPMGMTLRDLIHGNDYCQGIVGDRGLKAFAPSGPSGGFLPAKLTTRAGLPRNLANNKAWQELVSRRGLDPATEELDILDLELELNVFRALSPTQALGAGLTVYAEGRDMAVEALNSLEFYRNESCGKCVPCRMGSQKMVSIGSNLIDGKFTEHQWGNEMVPLIAELGTAIEMASICGLGRSVPVPLRTVINYFPSDVAKHLGVVRTAATT